MYNFLPNAQPFTNKLIFMSFLYSMNALVFLPSLTVLCTIEIITSQCERCLLEHNRTDACESVQYECTVCFPNCNFLMDTLFKIIPSFVDCFPH